MDDAEKDSWYSVLSCLCSSQLEDIETIIKSVLKEREVFIHEEDNCCPAVFITDPDECILSGR